MEYANFPGNDIGGIVSQGETIWDCQQRCQLNILCIGIVFRIIDASCFLKSRLTNRVEAFTMAFLPKFCKSDWFTVNLLYFLPKRRCFFLL